MLFNKISSRAVSADKSRLVIALNLAVKFLNCVLFPNVTLVNTPISSKSISSNNSLVLTSMVVNSVSSRFRIFSAVFLLRSIVEILVPWRYSSVNCVRLLISIDSNWLSSACKICKAVKSSIPVTSSIPAEPISNVVTTSINAVGTCPSAEKSS